MRDRPKQTKPHDCHCGKAGKDLIVYKQRHGSEVGWVISCIVCGTYLSLPDPKFTRKEAITLWNRLQKEITEVLDGK